MPREEKKTKKPPPPVTNGRIGIREGCRVEHVVVIHVVRSHVTKILVPATFASRYEVQIGVLVGIRDFVPGEGAWIER